MSTAVTRSRPWRSPSTCPLPHPAWRTLALAANERSANRPRLCRITRRYAAAVHETRDEQRSQKASAPKRVPDGELGVAVHARRQHDRNLADARAVATEDEEALEEEPVGAG